MRDVPIKVLFLCTGNSARSILAEAILAQDGAGRFAAASAGSNPAGQVNPWALKTLGDQGYQTKGYASKSWHAFKDGPAFDCIVTVCDNAAAETCPVWPGQPIAAHWGIPDPAAETGSDADKAAAFALAFARMKRRIDALLALPAETLSPSELARAMQAIGKQAETA